MKNKTTYRVDCTMNNERLYIDVRDDISLLQALSADKNLGLDSYTMKYILSIRRSMLLTAENIDDDVIKITSKMLYRLQEEMLNEDKLTKKQEKAFKNKSKKNPKEVLCEKPEEAQKGEIGIVERQLDEADEKTLDEEEEDLEEPEE